MKKSISIILLVVFILSLNQFVFAYSYDVYKQYYGYSTCVASSGITIYNGPGTNYSVSSIKSKCYLNQTAYISGAVTGSDGRLYVRLPGWGSYTASNGKKYGFALASAFKQGYLCGTSSIVPIVEKQKTCTQSFRNRIFVLKNRNDAVLVQGFLQNFHRQTVYYEKNNYSTTTAAKMIYNSLIAPIYGGSGVISESNITLGSKYSYGNWTIQSWHGGKYYALVFYHY